MFTPLPLQKTSGAVVGLEMFQVIYFLIHIQPNFSLMLYFQQLAPCLFVCLFFKNKQDFLFLNFLNSGSAK